MKQTNKRVPVSGGRASSQPVPPTGPTRQQQCSPGYADVYEVCTPQPRARPAGCQDPAPATPTPTTTTTTGGESDGSHYNTLRHHGGQPLAAGSGRCDTYDHAV